MGAPGAAARSGHAADARTVQRTGSRTRSPSHNPAEIGIVCSSKVFARAPFVLSRRGTIRTSQRVGHEVVMPQPQRLPDRMLFPRAGQVGSGPQVLARPDKRQDLFLGPGSAATGRCSGSRKDHERWRCAGLTDRGRDVDHRSDRSTLDGVAQRANSWQSDDADEPPRGAGRTGHAHRR